MKKINWFPVFIAIPLILIAVILFSQKVEIAKAVGSITRSGSDIPNGSLKMRTSDSTTTPEFIVAGISTSTLTFFSGGLSAAGIELQIFASSTATQSKIQVERLESDDNINFYTYQVASSTNFLIYDPAEGATSTVYMDLGLISARYTKINIGISTTTSGGIAGKDRANVWANIVGNIQGIY